MLNLVPFRFDPVFFPNRSEAMRDLIRQDLVRKEWMRKGEIAGAITITYDYHRRDLLN